MARIPLTERPLDLIYFIFFAIHLPTALFLDLQPLYNQQLVPAFMTNLTKSYLTLSNDPLIANASGFGPDQPWIWFRCFQFLEAVFQVPVFIFALDGLWKGTRSVYLVLLIYAASTSTTTLPCLAVILSAPVVETAKEVVLGVSITAQNQLLLLAGYVPFFLIPLLMTVDMAIRVAAIMQAGGAAQLAAKEK